MTQAKQAPEKKPPKPPSFVPFADQAMYLAQTAGGPQSVIQLLWLYHRPVDMAALTRFRDNLAHGRLARLIRPALLPFGRHQWASPPIPSSPLGTMAAPIAPEAVQTWADAQVELPLDPTQGPAWNFTVQSVTGGSTAVSLVVSHCVTDGMATALAVREAARGERRPPGYPPQSAQRSAAALGHEVLQAMKDAPATLAALSGVIRTLRAPRNKASAPVFPQVTAAADDQFVALPWVSLRLPTSEWDAKARSLGTNRFTLLAAMTAAFAEALGRVRGNETTLLIPVNQREGASDAGANCVSLATMKVPTGEPHGRLHAFQRRLQTTLLRMRREPDPLAALLPLVPFVPKRAFSAAGNLALGALADLPVTCSFIGDWPLDVLSIDGIEADRFCFRGTDRQVSVRAVESRQGVASVPACVISGFLFLNFVAYQPGVVTEHRQLRAMVEGLLARYGFSGEFFDG